ncbi:dihydropteroate synthase, partial [Staphylococcus felis]
SVDTFRSEFAEAALESGASIINDQWGGLYDPKIFDIASQHGASIVLMHNGDVQSDQAVMDEMIVKLLKQANIAERECISH